MYIDEEGKCTLHDLWIKGVCEYCRLPIGKAVLRGTVYTGVL